MYRQNSLLMGVCSVVGFIVAVNSFFMDTISTAQNLTSLFHWLNITDVDKYVSQLFISVESFIDVMGFWFVFLPIAFLVWRSHARN